jgi:hypothetical protein
MTIANTPSLKASSLDLFMAFLIYQIIKQLEKLRNIASTDWVGEHNRF